MQIPYNEELRPDTGLYNAKLGIWLFLASEIMLFGGLFSAYILLRTGDPYFLTNQHYLNIPLATLNTALLITSSVTMVMAWVSLKLDNLYIILDINNNIILGDPRKCLNLGNIEKKLNSFGIKTEKCNGHNFFQISNKLKKLQKYKGPSCLLANTVKGKGIKIMENKPNWHYWNNISENIYYKSLRYLNSLL